MGDWQTYQITARLGLSPFKITLYLKPSETIMHESTLNLFCDHEDQKNEIDNAFDMALEELAAELEVTVDYFMEEFLV